MMSWVYNSPYIRDLFRLSITWNVESRVAEVNARSHRIFADKPLKGGVKALFFDQGMQSMPIIINDTRWFEFYIANL